MKRSLFLSLVFFMFSSLSLASLENAKNENTEVRVSWYGERFHGKLTASGEVYDMNEFTAAHKKLPFGTQVKITNIRNDKSVIVTINDRGPFHKDRKFDLSKAAFQEIANDSRGVISVTYEIL
ncbi:MAG: septal ring lytic transglycosylase RlpA family protein [Flavobacteriaceae bacterium]|nr:septal ring lytic transglycosylase RlpA family protein [Flavobacteriaceae bacterium]